MPLLRGALALMLFIVAGCAHRGPPPVDVDALRCGQLPRSLPPSALGLPNGGVVVSSTAWVDATPARAVAAGEWSLALPSHCRVVGYIDPVDPAAPKINFQLNLPHTWNQRALQFGSQSPTGGLVVNGLGAAPLAPPDVPLPITRGYATFGSDAGHQRRPGVELHAFAANDEALLNFAHAATKKVRDAAVALIQAHYGRKPARLYHVGEGEGGREGLQMAQRYPADYDGIYAAAPWLSYVGQHLAAVRAGILLRGAGWLDAKKLALLDKAVLGECDALDGQTDGVVGHFLGCAERFDPAVLRCRAGAAPDECLTEAQLSALRALFSPFRLDFALSHGVQEEPGFGLGGASQPFQWERYVTGMAPGGAAQALNWQQGSGMLRHFVVRDAAFDPAQFRPNLYRARLQRLSSLLDATDPDLSAFDAWGGKLILHEFGSDYARSPRAGMAYFQALQARLSAPVADRFVRFYLTPGLNHAGYGPDVPASVDVLRLLEQWVEQGKPPDEPATQTLRRYAPPFPVLASRPMCRYPAYPRYRGSGEPRQATSYTCAAP